MNYDLLHLYIEEYKKESSSIQGQEIYKWRAIKQF